VSTRGIKNRLVALLLFISPNLTQLAASS
jgi:hypothetical protein